MGNKKDQRQTKKPIQKEQMETLNNLGIKKIKEVSAFTNFGVSEVFHEIIEALLHIQGQIAPIE